MVPLKGFLECGVQLEIRTPSGSPIWLFPASFSPARFINDPCYTKAEAR